MARLITCGAEIDGFGTGSAGIDTSLNNTYTRDTTVFRSGLASYQSISDSINPSAVNIGPAFTTVLSRTYYARLYFKFGTFDTSGSIDIFCGQNAGTLAWSIKLSGGIFVPVVALFDESGGGTGVQIGNSLPVDTSIWYRFEVSFTTNASNLVSSVTFKLNGDNNNIQSGNIATPLAVGLISAGWGVVRHASSSAHQMNMDDFALNDNQGASQNTYPGEGRVVLLVPISDNAKGTGWTNDLAGTTNLFDAVNNKPPVGIADTTAGSGLHQLRNATSNANVNYDANMTSYSTAGLGIDDVITVIDPIIATGAPVTTSAKAGTVGVASNPAIANISLGAGGTAGAFWSGVAAGTYPTGWKISHGTTTYRPGVTNGTSPVMRVTQVTSSTRIAIVCFMGIYVEYVGISDVPGVIDRRTPRRRTIQRM